MAHCMNCGGSIDDDWKVCPKCGKPVANTQKHAPPDNRRNAIIGIVVFVVVVGLVVVGALLPDRHGSTTTVLRAPTDGRKVIVASSTESLDEMLSAGSDKAIAVVVASGGGFLVDQGTEVAATYESLGVRKVRVLEGSQIGSVGYVPKEWVVSR